jgi:hypothetical protein
MKRPPELYFLFILLLMLGINALMAGLLMIIQPNGSLLQISPVHLKDSMFNSFIFPGLLLFMFNGVFPLLALVGLLFKPKWVWANAFNIYPDKYWAWTYSLFSGIILIFWVTVQITMIPYFWLQPLFIGLGLLIIIFTMMPRVIKYFSFY